MPWFSKTTVSILQSLFELCEDAGMSAGLFQNDVMASGGVSIEKRIKGGKENV